MVEAIVGRYIGVVLNGAVAFVMIANSLVGLLRPQLYAHVIAPDGWGSETVLPVALLALVSGVLQAVPRTAALGAIFITGFSGGALAVHLRVTQAVIWPELVKVALGAGAWVGLWLQDLRLRALIPLR